MKERSVKEKNYGKGIQFAVLQFVVKFANVRCVVKIL